MSCLQKNMTSNSYKKILKLKTFGYKEYQWQTWLSSSKLLHSYLSMNSVSFRKILIPERQGNCWGRLCVCVCVGKGQLLHKNTEPVCSSKLNAQKKTLLHFWDPFHPLAVSPYLYTLKNLHILLIPLGPVHALNQWCVQCFQYWPEPDV